MPRKITEAECKAMNFNWDGKNCTEPKIGLVKMAVHRGSGCDGRVRVEEIRKRLPKATRRVMLKYAVRPKRK